MKNSLPRKRFKLTMEYDGTRFSGWQKQNDARTIQGSLLEVGAALFNDPEIDIQGNGRTDAGVHALQYVAHMETTTSLPPAAILTEMNELLPTNIVLLGVEPCHPQFHARHHCIGRSYLYQIAKRKTAFQRRYVWWVRDQLDTLAMAETLQLFVGMHDFVSFAEKQELKKSTKVMINAALLKETEDLITIRIVGSHFLWKMIRRLAGILVEVGRHHLTPAEVGAFFEQPSDIPSRFTASPSGLFFERAFYVEAEFEAFLSKISQQS
nr:tRNA pseudouridine(38-40) synthase TruA [Desulfobulbaceae bacterium]